MSEHRRTARLTIAAATCTLVAAACAQGQEQSCLRRPDGTAVQRSDSVTLRFDHAGAVTWREAYQQGFANEARLDTVGYAMAGAIERHCGSACIRRRFEQAPVEYFRQYVRLYRVRPEITGRFAPETERLLGVSL
jgi:hypothetical protein